MTDQIPEGFHTVTPHLALKDAGKAIEFYEEAFGAQEIFRSRMPDGRIIHATIKIGDSHLYIRDEFPEQSSNSTHQALKGGHVTMHIHLQDVDISFQQAVDAGAESLMPPQDMFGGARYARLVDRFGQIWSMATQKEIVSPDELESRHNEFFNESAGAVK